MKFKRLLTLCCALSMTLGMATVASAADYSFKTSPDPAYTDFSYLNEMGDNRITLITCIANQPSLRLCVQAVEIR